MIQNANMSLSLISMLSQLHSTESLICRSVNETLFSERVMFLFQYEIAIVTEEGVEIVGPLSSETNWDIAHMVR